MTALASEQTGKVKKFIKFITFVNMPIKEKFIFFFFGVLFWFIVMFVIGMGSSIVIDSKTDKIVNHLIPHERVTQKIIRNLQSLSIDISEIEAMPDTEGIDRKIAVSNARIADILSFTEILSHGGQAPDINRDSNALIDNVSIPASDHDPNTETYTQAIKTNINAIGSKISLIADMNKGVPANIDQDKGSLDNSIDETKKLLLESISISNAYSASEASSYAENSESIKNVTKTMIYTFIGVLFMATTLLIIFTISISRSIARPVKAIIEQIRLVGEGRVDITNKIKVSSKDEIGVLTQDFNDLMEEINDLVTFKQIIEEDDSLEDVYSRLAHIFDRFGLDEFIIYEISNSQNKMKTVSPIILNENDINCNPDILHDCSLCKVRKTGHIISSFDYPKVCKQFRTDIDKIHVCIPMLISGSVGGVVQLLFNKKYFSGKDRRVYKAEQYINEAVPVIEAKRLTNTLKESALKDALTGLYNRRFLQEYTDTLIAGVLRRKKNIGLIMCDLDYFKQVNDIYGHNIGDEILKKTSEVIRQCVRGSDLVIRFGGEEFLLITLDIEENETMEIAEKIRKTMEETKIKVFDGVIKKTISLGISEFPKDTDAFWQAIKYADVALYKAKETGRNKAVRFTQDMWTENEF
ncbi:MAG: diguanylate cyclase [Thermodesulfovibrionia bacterium]|nr:diguanylate cyclase [Thermodesulfovibrionia bacterium]